MKLTEIHLTKQVQIGNIPLQNQNIVVYEIPKKAKYIKINLDSREITFLREDK